jgi:baseplate J-like protein
MTLPSPNLDDRDFRQLLEEAHLRIVRACPEWTDQSPSDPGMVLLELFAHLTETMIYRLNRLPDKAYIELLRLMGVRLQPPSAAAVTLRFSLARPQASAVPIPRGTRVTIGRSGGEAPPTFLTSRAVALEPGQTEVEVLAYEGIQVDGELAGVGTGLPGLSVKARRSPIVAPAGEERNLLVGVEAGPEELKSRAPVIELEGKSFRIWREVEDFTNLGQDQFVHIADRITGTIAFASSARMRGRDGGLEDRPAALAEVPGAGKQIRLWYRHGGGPKGNVAPNTLTTLKDSIPGVQVTNPGRATGGREAESLENALIRGPQELHSLRRAVTARDFELLALRSSGAVARAKAFPPAMLWRHAVPGTVEVLLVPALPEEMRAGALVTAKDLKEHEAPEARDQIQRELDERRPLGTTCQVSWVRYKTVQVKARIVVRRGEDAEAVHAQVVERIHQTINPLPTPLNPSGWPFGEPLRASKVYETVLSEPGVSYVEPPRFVLDEVPKPVLALTADPNQPGTWYAASGETLFRSINDGEGWEPAGRFPGEGVAEVRAHPGRPGLLAVANVLAGQGAGSSLHVSWDCGESWKPAGRTAFVVQDIAWTLRDGEPILLMATEAGLFELGVREGSTPLQIPVVPQDQERGYFAVAVLPDALGGVSVGLAAQENRGVFLSTQEGRPNTFVNIGLQGKDVRVLSAQQMGPRTFLWAGVAAAGNEPGLGCFRLELVNAEPSAAGWQAFEQGWKGGSCRSVAFQGARIHAATFRSGVLSLAPDERQPAWRAPDVECGLPLRDVARFHPVDSVAADPGGRLLLAGGVEGVYRSRDAGVKYERVSKRELEDQVTLPGTWLFCSGEHDIAVVSENETH